jgi:hypothetical protein
VTDIAALVARLEAYAKDQGGWHNIDDTCEAAASALKAQAAEIAVLKGEITIEHCRAEAQAAELEKSRREASLVFDNATAVARQRNAATARAEAAEVKLRKAVEVMRTIRRLNDTPTRYCSHTDALIEAFLASYEASRTTMEKTDGTG